LDLTDQESLFRELKLFVFVPAGPFRDIIQEPES